MSQYAICISSVCAYGGAAGIRTRVQLSRQIASTLQVYLYTTLT
jgi:hypothetical protein